MDIKSIKTIEDNKEKSFELVGIINANINKSSTLLKQIITPMKEVMKKNFMRGIIREFKEYFNDMDFHIYENRVIGFGYEYIASYKKFSISIMVEDDNVDGFDLYIYRDKNKQKAFDSMQIICELEIEQTMKTLDLNRFYDIVILEEMLEQSEEELFEYRSMIISENMSVTPKIKAIKRNKDVMFDSILEVLEHIE